MQTNPSDWFINFKKSDGYQTFVKNPVAYFSAEYALDSAMPTYAGGLGVLAGDYVREVAMQEFPLVAVGLFYKKAQSILSLEGNNSENKLKIVKDKNNQELIVFIPMDHRVLKAKAWQWEDNGTKVYLLDTDIEENDPQDRLITNKLYDEDRDVRLKQEILLGIGGFRLLAGLGYHASVYHLNEGHSAFLALELVRHEMEHQKVDFKTACDFAQKHIIFTNHTLVPAGQEQFTNEKVGLLIDPCAKEICINSSDIVKLGSFEDDSSTFSMTTLSFKLSEKSNGVSKFHTQKAKEIWPNQKMENITNGIFIKRWDKLGGLGKGDIWEKHLENKIKLLDMVKEKTGDVWSSTDLIFVWARRLVEYKQPLLFFDNVDKLVEISKNSSVPIRVIFSGPTGEVENPFVKEIKKIIEDKLKGTAIFIPNYSLDVAEVLTAGADVWLNTPMAGTEACGTSGMKAALNGALALSTNDGWIHEVAEEDVGWVLKNEQNGEEIMRIIENEIIPVYLEHLKNPIDSIWAGRMERARNLIQNNFSTSRTLQGYIEKLYIPTLKQKHTHK
ncbi:MAG TPA: alpha-glucan family phosphorylase [Candidatus Paceibacterota bacterium]